MFDSLQTGSILPYLERAKAEGYAVVVLNPNFNEHKVKLTRQQQKQQLGKATVKRKRFEKKQQQQEKEQLYDNDDEEEEVICPIPGNENGFKHALCVWDSVIRRRAAFARQIGIVAHSFGGNFAIALMADRWRQLRRRLKAVAFLDSVHDEIIIDGKTPRPVVEFLQMSSKHWVRSNRPLDDEEEEVIIINQPHSVVSSSSTSSNFSSTAGHCCLTVSGGVNDHDRVPAAAMESVFHFLRKQMC